MAFLKRFLLWSLALATLAALAGYAALWTTLPRTTGEIAIPAGRIGARVEVLRDARGVPHILADSPRDAHFALGYVHAQDRMFQMEMMRRLGAGRLAEVAGEAALPSDRLMRTLGLHALARRQFDTLGPSAREALSAYADGVNAWLDGHGGLLPVDLLALGIRPEPWSPADSLVWGKLMGLHLGGGWRDEAARMALLKVLPADLVESLWPAAPATLAAPPPATAAAAGDMSDSTLAAVATASPLPPVSSRGASNAWVAAGDRTATGKPLLAADPHLEFGMPILWYLARIVTPEGTLAGATAPGVPFVIIGHNGRVAWGLTASHVDTEDLFVERLTAGDPGRYDTPGGSAPFDLREESIAVRGGGAIRHIVRATRHGVVISDVSGRAAEAVSDGHVLALAAPFLLDDDRTPDALAGMNRARDAAGFEAALADLGAPSQTVVFADTGGRAGWLTAGRIPLRAAGNGRYPAPGWDGTHDWTGFIPFEGLPRGRAEGVAVAANQRPAADDYPFELGSDFPPPLRADRIRALLAEERLHTVDSFSRIQRDSVSPLARELLPLLIRCETRNQDTEHALRLLESWNGDMSRRRPEPLIFAQWLLDVHHALLGDLPEAVLRARPAPDVLFLREALRRPDCPWLKGRRGGGSLSAALATLRANAASDVAHLRWGDRHQARFAHPLSRLHPLLGRILDRATPTDGGNDTINRGGMRLGDRAEPFTHVHGAGLRAVFDLADLDRSRFMIATGQSGNPFSAHFDDLLTEWRDGRHMRLGLSRRDILSARGELLVLTPK